MKGFFILLNVACISHMISSQNDVRLPPTIRRSPKLNTTIYRMYENVTLEFRAEGTPTVRYEWKKNGLQLNTNLSNIRKESDGTIIINRATDSDEGCYQCFAKNQYGTALSDIICIRMAFVDSSTVTETVQQQTVVEGMPFYIQAYRHRSFPESSNEWVKGVEIDANSTRLLPSKRMQIAENGDLHFAYALPEDADGEGIYTSYTSNLFLNVQILGSYTQLTVTKNPAGNISQFAPTLAFSSAEQTVALIGGNVTFRCFFYGYPEPSIRRFVPHSTFLSGRFERNKFNTEVIINNIIATDQGNYRCVASNTQGNITQVHQLRVEDVPKFQNKMDGPYDVNVTEGDSVTFNCNASAIPEANITWFQNGQPIDTDNPPMRFVISNDNKTLTIRDVCRDCVDRENKTDLMVIQCNASNVHGYAFAQGYLNVLMKTKVTIRGSENVSVDFLEVKEFVFQCYAKSDPSTPPTVRWFKTKPFDYLVRDELPYVHVAMDNLVIRIDPKCSANCAKYLGEYRCVGDNGYTRENRTITLGYQYRSPTGTLVKKKETWASWKIFLGAGAIVLVLFLIGIVLGFRSKRCFVDVYSRMKERRMTTPLSAYKDAVCDRGHSIPLEEVAVQSESERSPNSNEQSESKNTYLDLNRDEVKPILDLEKSYFNSKEMNPYLVPVSKEMNPYLDPVSKEANPYLDPVSKEVNPYLNPVSKEVNPYLDLVSKEVNPYLDPVLKEVNNYLIPVSKEVNPYLVPVSKETNPCLDPVSTGVNPYLDLVSKEVNPYLDAVSKEVNPYLDAVSTEVNPYLNQGSKE